MWYSIWISHITSLQYSVKISNFPSNFFLISGMYAAIYSTWKRVLPEYYMVPFRFSLVCNSHECIATMWKPNRMLSRCIFYALSSGFQYEIYRFSMFLMWFLFLCCTVKKWKVFAYLISQLLLVMQLPDYGFIS